MNLVQQIQAEQARTDLPAFRVGDTVRVSFKIVEGRIERIQAYEGLVIAIKNSGASKTFTVRKNSYGVGVERVFPLNSPRVDKVEIVKTGKVRRAKLYYIRTKVGKKSKVKTLVGGRKSDKPEA
ncbi:MAG: 50S ribosomal protein L19 [Spirochaetota bacterium]|jgi:large subunit ribosomal protein L19|uniref:Large ribosomal subunit protein bL19 n=1 Tax=uncultured spirochete TaxID=156406 RepID=A0A3P3XKX7_9SPIR|nr:50S ribosomal protein L19 [Rectinema subterraneum]SLM15069.1 50S ribosomal subunit protein L19 [uncultured spirochete]HBE46007.1 50S ribosomal protein L19 [Spirochaetaceae bacterium]HCX95932.1 50S ribosomal protein L19 [Spirochaetaceae bacterium]